MFKKQLILSMKTYHKILTLLLFMLPCMPLQAQTTSDANALIKEGVTLHDAGKYDEAIAKYKAALKIDPENMSANYELSFTLFSSNQGKEAIPYLEKVIASQDGLKAQACDLLGSIYDDDKQPGKALEYYKKGIEADPNYQRLHFNMAITYYGQKQYAESELSAINAIKLDPKHASSHRIFAMAANRQNQLGRSLLGWCNFLLIEPQTKRSAEAMAYVKAIVNNGVKKTGEKSITISINEKDLSGSNLLMPMTVATATDNQNNLTAPDSLSLQLTALFKIAHTITGDKDQPFVSSYYSDFFETLAKSGNMPSFTRYISLSVYNTENTAWFKEHDKELTAFDNWMQATKREF